MASLRRELSIAERNLGDAHAAGEQLAQENDRLRTEVADLTMRRETERRDRVDLQYDSEHLRYLAMYAGSDDPIATDSGHHGEWTAGRPYLGFSHCWAPGTRDCYETDVGGAASGLAPGRSPRWARCPEGSRCPVPHLSPEEPPVHPLADGTAVRQGQWWWDEHPTRWRIAATPSDAEGSGLSDEHLLGVIAWLHSELRGLWRSDTTRRPLLVPCPSNAYRSAADWLLDLPVYRALESEKRRRRLRWGPGEKPELVDGELTWGR